MKRLVSIAVILLASSAWATNAHYQNYCSDGGQKVVVQGLNSTNYVQQSFPQCTVTVYVAGTNTLASLFYQNASSHPNPFLAGNDAYYDFYIDVTVSFDVTQSGGGLAAPVTLSNISLSTGGGGGGGGDATSILSIPIVFSSLAMGNLLEYNGTDFVNQSPIWCPLLGCTFGGNVTLFADPGPSSPGLQAATKNYVLTSVAGFVKVGTDGFITPSQLGGGTASSSTALFGDKTYKSVPGTGACSGKVVTAVNGGAPPTCNVVDSTEVDPTSIVIKAQAGVANGYVPLDSGNSASVANNLTVGGQLLISGSFYQTSPCPVSTPGAPSAGLGAWGYDTDCYIHEWPGTGPGAGVEVKVATVSGATVSGHAAVYDSAGNLIDGGTTGTGNVSTVGLTANKVLVASGATTAVDSAITDDMATLITLGRDVALSDATPVISTTVANAGITFTPNGTGTIGVPNGTVCTNPAIFFAANALTGFVDNTSAIGGWCANGSETVGFTGNGLALPSNKSSCFTASAVTNTQDTCTSRTAAGVMAIGTTNAAGDETGLIRSANTQKRASTDYTNATTTPSNLFSWSLPAVAKQWSFDCKVSYYTSATTDHLVLSINASQTPTTEFAHARIYTDTIGASTSANVVATASGNQPALTGGAPAATGSANVYEADIFGGIEASATAGTFAIQAAGGAAGTITILRDTSCILR